MLNNEYTNVFLIIFFEQLQQLQEEVKLMCREIFRTLK